MRAEEDDETEIRCFASPPCLMHEFEGESFDVQQGRDVSRWRKAERERLIAARLAMPADLRIKHARAIAADLEKLIAAGPSTAVSLYWPFRGEPDLRPFMQHLTEQGCRVALPVVIAKGRPLRFREWRPGARLERGIWNIPFPADGAELVPTVVIAPLVGFDRACYRLGYGGGFFDRTLASAAPRPLAIGIGYAAAELRTIYPQAHDIPMDRVVTGVSPVLTRD